LCDRKIATNFGVVAKELILVDYCAVIVIYFAKIKKRNRYFACGGTIQYGTITVQN
jgi:translation initiation factor 1 (eIF-1/SUI1)